jgi:hypothetical protein
VEGFMSTIYDIVISYNKKTGKTGYGLIKDGKDNLSPNAEELKLYFSITKLVMDKLGLRLKSAMGDKDQQ